MRRQILKATSLTWTISRLQLILCVVFFLSSNLLSAQDQLPMTLPKIPNAVDKQGRKQGYWLNSKNEYDMVTIDLYKDDVAVRRFEYYDNNELFWVCSLKDGQTDGLLQYFTDGNLAQLQWEKSGATDFEKSLDVTEKKLAEVTAKHGRVSYERGLWLLNVATYLNAVGRYRQAEAQYLESLDILKAANVDQLTVRSTAGALIDFYLESGMYNKALRLLPERLAQEKSDNRMHYYYAYLAKVAECYQMLNMRDSAVVTFGKIFDYRMQSVQKDSVKDYEYAMLYRSWKELAEAKDDSVLIEKMITHADSVWDERSGNYNNHILDPAFRFYVSREKYRRAWELVNRAMAIQEQIPDNTWYISWHPDIADLYYRQGKYQLAARKYEEVLAIYDNRDLNKRSFDYLDYHWRLARVYDDWGKPLKARHWYNAALKISKTYTDSYALNYVVALQRLGNHLINNHLVDEGEAILLEALSRAAEYESEDGPTYLSILRSMGESYSAAGLSAKAENIYLRVRDAYERNYGKDHIEYANILTTLGGLYSNLGMFDKSRQCLQEALSLTEKEYGTDNMQTVEIINNIFSVYFEEYMVTRDQASLTKMGEYSSKYLNIIEKFRGVGSEHYATALNQRGLFYMYKGFYREAREHFTDAKKIYDSLKLFDYYNYHTFVHNIGQTNQMMGNFDEARSGLSQAIAYKLKAGRESNVAVSYRSMAITEWRSHNLKAAQANLKLSFDLQLKKLEDLAFLTEAEREAFWDAFSGDLDEYKALLTEYTTAQKSMSTELFNVVMNTKAQLLRASTKWNRKIKSSTDTTVVKAFAEWEELKSVMARNAVVENEQQDEADSIQRRVQELEKFLTTKTAYFGKVKPDPVFDWKEVRARLKKNEAVLEIVRIAKRGAMRVLTDSSDSRLPSYPYFGKTDTIYYAALIVKHNSKYPELVLMTNGNEMERYEKGFTNMVKNKISETRSFDLFWKPFQRLLKDVDKIYISPDGIYSTINLNILFNPATRKYLIDEKNIMYIGTVRDLLIASNNKYDGTEDIVVVARPKFDLDDPANNEKGADKPSSYTKTFYELPRDVKRSGDELDELPATGREAMNIANEIRIKGWQTKILLDEEASEENVKQVRSPKVLHIATHGFFWPANPGSKSNPLLRSGLMLAGAKKALGKEGQSAIGDNREDGVLTAYEVKELDLSGTDLVVLSACETGLGNQRNGEGVYGLQRSFIIAGAKTLIMSLWKVGDESTSELMTLFYKNWINGGSKVEAFKNAQIKLREKFPDPVDWGGFVLVGTD